MTFHARFGNDGTIEGVNLGGADFEQSVDWAVSLLEQCDGRFLQCDGDAITLRVDEGTAVYRVTERFDGPYGACVKTKLESVVR